MSSTTNVTRLLLDGRVQAFFTIGFQSYLLDPVKEGTFGMYSDMQRLAPVMREPLKRKVFSWSSVRSSLLASAAWPSVPC